ncbi:hypothetical protein C8R43DRAFT_1037625 [Mycena crocata]|nr:hypothetical protein C8R43DRAFT_1037625 [Mycena crocata]
MKQEMKTDLSLDDPITAAAAVLALAVEQAKRAICDARAEPSPSSIALAVCEAKCSSLEAQVASHYDALALLKGELENRDARITILDDAAQLQKRDLDTANELCADIVTAFNNTAQRQKRDLDSARALTVQRDAQITRMTASSSTLRKQISALQTTLKNERRNRRITTSSSRLERTYLVYPSTSGNWSLSSGTLAFLHSLLCHCRYSIAGFSPQYNAIIRLLLCS